jgi:heme/copper-type cytochrome/quinol oxidase subunit 3
MTAAELRSDHLLPPAWKPSQEVGWWAMALVCASEAALFAYFIVSYFYLGVSNPAWPPAGVELPKLEKPLIMTAMLVSSSIVLILAEKQREHGKRAIYRTGMVVTVLLGLGFLAIQAGEYHEKVKSLGPTSNAYASLFYTITGFHGAHVAFGLLLLLFTLLRDVRGRIDPERPIPVKVASLYWHFVDAVWLVILTTLYLSPRWT